MTAPPFDSADQLAGRLQAAMAREKCVGAGLGQTVSDGVLGGLGAGPESSA